MKHLALLREMTAFLHSFCHYEGLTEYVSFLFLFCRDSDFDLQSLILLFYSILFGKGFSEEYCFKSDL